jgi:beta-phosphoglucomutase-like phosphatase (HAD superfamily)
VAFADQYALGAGDFPRTTSCCIQAIIVGEECARAKPHPDPYLDGAKALGLGLDEVFAVEDSPSGAPHAACS